LYRLDYETSGLMIYVCDELLLQELRDQFSKLVKEKIYQVVVSGKYTGPSELIHFIKGSGPKNSRMIEAKNGDSEAVRAELKICESEYDSKLDVTKLKVQLLSGHRHQIRVQFSIMNHPIVGDPIYGGREYKRMLLHAYSYSINHPKLTKSWTSNINLFNTLS
jgi:23S rRNA pseudouridine1911/1915/1917 synthase